MPVMILEEKTKKRVKLSWVKIQELINNTEESFKKEKLENTTLQEQYKWYDLLIHRNLNAFPTDTAIHLGMLKAVIESIEKYEKFLPDVDTIDEKNEKIN